MKNIIIFTLLFFTSGLIAQINPFLDGMQSVWVTQHNTYLTTSVAPYGQNYLRVEHEITESFVNLQLSYQTDFRQHFLQAKMGVGYSGQGVRAYVYLPYFNYSFNENAYSTPFCAEVFVDRLTPKIGLSCNFDIYKDQIVPSIRIRMKAFHFTQTRTKPVEIWK